MRRATIVAVLSLAIVALGGATVSAHGRGGPRVVEPTYVARAGTAEQGGWLLVAARVKHAKPCTPFSASAVVRFKVAGNVPVDLKQPRGQRCDRRGHHGAFRHHPRRGVTLVARAWVKVGANETPGEVPVEVTITYGGTVKVLQATGLILGDPPTEEEEPTTGGEPPEGQQDQ
jgi:hypothetical protein